MGYELGRFPPIDETGFFKPDLTGLKDRSRLRRAEKLLEEYVEEGKGEKGKPGEVLRVTAWDDVHTEMAIFDILTGQQIGLVQTAADKPYLESFLPKGLVPFETTTLIASGFRRHGLASLARSHLKKFIASRVDPNFITVLRSVVMADPKDVRAVRTMLQHSGAGKVSNHLKGNSLDEMWIEYVVASGRPVPTTLDINQVVFCKGDERLNLDISVITDSDDYASYQPVQDQWLVFRRQGYGARSEFEFA